MDGQTSGQSIEGEEQSVVTGEEGNKWLDIQKGDLTILDIIVNGQNATRHLVYMLLLDSEDGKIGQFQDMDFEFPWKTVNVKQYEFVVASKFIELLQSEYGFMYEYTQVNKYCVNVKKNGGLFEDNLALKVARNVQTGNINHCEIVSIQCTEKWKAGDVSGSKNVGGPPKKQTPVTSGGANTDEVDLSHVKIEKVGDKDKHSKKSSGVVKKPLTQEEWLVIQNMRKHGKIKMCICMYYFQCTFEMRRFK